MRVITKKSNRQFASNRWHYFDWPKVATLKFGPCNNVRLITNHGEPIFWIRMSVCIAIATFTQTINFLFDNILCQLNDMHVRFVIWNRMLTFQFFYFEYGLKRVEQTFKNGFVLIQNPIDIDVKCIKTCVCEHNLVISNRIQNVFQQANAIRFRWCGWI